MKDSSSVALFHFNYPSEAHLLLHAVPSVHVFNVIEEVADGVHEAEMLTVLIHRLEHLIEGHSNLKDSTRLHQEDMIPLYLCQSCLHLQHAPCPLLLETLQKRPHQVIHVQQLELGLNDGLQRL